MKALISTSELKEIFEKPGVRLLDASYGLPPSSIRIGHAQDFDIDEVADHNAQFAHTLPTPAVFADAAEKLGISNSDHVVVYDRSGIAMAAARVWWMFRTFGHDKVQVLDGGLPAWVNAGYPVTEKADDILPRGAFKPAFRPELFKKRDDIVQNLTDKNFTVLDARDPRRYSGDMAEPRPGMGSGHIPGSLSLPYASLIDNQTGLFKTGDALTSALASVDTTKPVAISCGSGVTACVVAIGLHNAGHTDAAVYGGSWAEWGGDASLPKTKGSQP
jgi:thiosulfate/3-mercaptopyruvate sulfurtransferase